MAEIVTGDPSKSIKGIGELALRISKFDSYRLFTLYEDVKERKVMNVSGDQRYYLVFRSLKKEIRIPEYDPKGFFEVDKVNGCILFKITKKNAEDILSMKTAGEKIFHIIRVFEERDEFGKVLNVTDEVEVYNGKWGDDYAFSVFSTENKIDLLTKALAVQVDKNAKLLADYNALQSELNSVVAQRDKLSNELAEITSERDYLQAQLDELRGNTYDGTVLSTDTKYIALEDTLENVSFTEEQYKTAINELLTKGSVNLSDNDDDNEDKDDPKMTIVANVNCAIMGVKITVYRNGSSIGSATYGYGFEQVVYADHGDKFEFKCTGMTDGVPKTLTLKYKASGNGYDGAVKIDNGSVSVINTNPVTAISGVVNYNRPSEDSEEDTTIGGIGNMGELICEIL
jgi:hypothetical protein